MNQQPEEVVGSSPTRFKVCRGKLQLVMWSAALLFQVAVWTPFQTAQGMGWGVQSPQGFTAITPTDPVWQWQGWTNGYRAIGPAAGTIVIPPLDANAGAVQLPGYNAGLGSGVGENLDGIDVK